MLNFKIWEDGRVIKMEDGKQDLIVGHIKDFVYESKRTAEEHLHFNHNGWGINCDLLKQLKERGVTLIHIYDTYFNEKFYVEVDILEKFSIIEEYGGHGKQFILPKKYWGLEDDYKLDSKGFVQLHVHTEYSLLDGLGHIEELVLRARRMKMNSMAITDHGNLFGIYKFHKFCNKVGIKPILGCEFYIVDDVTGEKTRARNHVCVFAKNEIGYKNLLKLSTLSNTAGFYYAPRIDKYMLAEYREGLIVSSACLAGYPLKMILDEREDVRIKEELHFWKSLFGDDYYIELHPDPLPDYKKANKKLTELAQEMGIKLIATNDVHYVYKKDKIIHDVILGINMKKTLKEGVGFDSDTYWFQSEQEIGYHFGKFYPEIDYRVWEEAISNTKELADKVEQFEIKGILELPQVKDGKSFDTIFNEMLGEAKDEERDRIIKECKVIKELGFENYFLLIADIVKWAKEQGIAVGAGRGSVAGSLVAYKMGITGVDPLKFDLLFERFLNSGRKVSPDIDIDFDAQRKDEVYEYINSNWNMAKISTFIAIQGKGTIKDCCRVLGINLGLAELMSKAFPVVDGMTLDWAILTEPQFAKFYSKNIEMFKIARRLEGRLKSKGVHPAGVIVSDSDLNNMVASRRTEGSKGDLCVQCDMEDVDTLGLLKVDCLSSKTQTVIGNVMKLSGVDDLSSIPLDDIKVFKEFSKGNTSDIFQFQSELGIETCKKIKPKDFETLSAITALIRPGAYDFIDEFKKNRYEPIFEEMKEILKGTRNIILYQEQSMRISQEVAGFTLNEADDLRKAIGKKLSDQMSKLRYKFIDGAVNKGFDKLKASKLFEIIDKSSNYSFNKCISGDTLIYRGHGGKGKSTFTIEELYKIKNDIKYAKESGHKSLRTKILMKGYGKILGLCEDGRIRPNKIVDIYFSGKKPVYEIMTSNHSKVRATGEHRFLTDSGWKRVKDISFDDRLIINGGYEATNFTGRYNFTDGNFKLNIEKGKEGFQKNSDGESVKFDNARREMLHTFGKRCLICDGLFERIETAHLDGDRHNNEKENLKNMCVSCHKKHDYKLGRKKAWSKGLKPKFEKVCSIIYAGEEDTYDIEMEAPNHNFIANGFVSHNSHAIAYTLSSYWSMWFKIYYPIDWAVAELSVYIDDDEKLKRYLNEARSRGIKILPPDVNKSEHGFIKEEDSIRCGLGMVKGVSENGFKEIQKKRPFADLPKFLSSIEGRKLNIGAKQALVKAGALDSFGYRRSLYSYFEKIKKSKSKKNIIIYKDIGEWDIKLLAKRERESLGFYLSGHPIMFYKDFFEDNNIDPKTGFGEKKKNKFEVGGIIESIKTWASKNGEMAFMDISGYKDYSINLWAPSWHTYKDHINVGDVVIIKGRQIDNGKLAIDVESGDEIVVAKEN